MFFTAGSAIRQASSKSGLTILLAAAALLGTAVSPASAKGPATESRLPVVKVDDLPMQAVDTLLLIREGPFPYSKDGVVFGNRERLLPAAPRSYYREYTVKTVGARDRGPGASCAGAPK